MGRLKLAPIENLKLPDRGNLEIPKDLGYRTEVARELNSGQFDYKTKLDVLRSFPFLGDSVATSSSGIQSC